MQETEGKTQFKVFNSLSKNTKSYSKKLRDRGRRGLFMTGLSRDTWKAGWTFKAGGSLSPTTLGLIMLSMMYGPMYLGASLRESV